MSMSGFNLRRPHLLAACAAVTAGVLAAVIVARRLRRMRTPDVLLADPTCAYSVALKRRESLGRNVMLLRFALQHARQVSNDPFVWMSQKLGVRVGEHIIVRATAGNNRLERPYTPVSHCDKQGSFEIIVKIYKEGVRSEYPKGGVMSQFLDTLQPETKFRQIRGPRGKFVYRGRGTFVTADGECLPPATMLGLIAAGSGVTPMLQLLRHVLADDGDETRFRMIDVNHSERDIIARRALDQYARLHSSRFRICHVLSELPSAQWSPGFIQGPLNRYIIAAHLAAPRSDAMVLCCGPPVLMEEVCKPALLDIGYRPKQLLFY